MSAARARRAPGDVLVLVGTMKGAFVFSSDERRKTWKMDGPFFAGQAVYSLAYDDRAGRTRILAGTQSSHWGGTIRISDDFGQTWAGP